MIRPEQLKIWTFQVIDCILSVYSEYDGVWHLAPRIEAGQYVHEGTVLGKITDYHGNPLATITAPASGILLIVFGTPPVNQGDNIVFIGLVDP